MKRERIAERAGSAVVWQGLQLGGVKIIFLARLLILAHLLIPEDFGLLAIAAIALDVLLDLTNPGLQPALVQRDELAVRHYDAAWTLGMVRALAVTLLVILTAPWVAEIFGEPRATNVIRLLAFRPTLQALASARVVDLPRALRFRALALMRLGEAGVAALVAIALAPAYGVWALVIGTLAGPVIFTASSYLVVPHRPRLLLRAEALRSLIRFGRWIFLAGLVSMLGRSFLQATISRRLGATELGLYFLAAKLAFLPAEVAGEVFGNVAFPLFSRIRANREKTAAAFSGLLSGIAALLVPAIALIVLLAPSLAALLGPQWAGTVPAIRLLAAASVIGLLSEAAVPLFKGVGKPGYVAALELTQYGLIAALVWELSGRYGLAGAAGAWLPAVLATQLVCLIFLVRVLGRPFAGLGPALTAIGVATAAGSAVAAAVEFALPGVAGLVVAASAGMAMVGLLLWALERRFGLGLLATLERVYPRLVGWLGLAAEPLRSR